MPEVPMPDTVFEVFEATARTHAARPAMRRKRGESWEPITWSEYRSAVRQAARGLAALGAAVTVVEAMDPLQRAIVHQYLAERHIPPQVTDPFEIKDVDVSVERSRRAAFWYQPSTSGCTRIRARPTSGL